MNKPFSLICEDFKKELTDLINNSVLPPSIIELILQSYLIEVNNAAKRQYQYDKIQYENILTNEKKETEENIIEVG